MKTSTELQAEKIANAAGVQLDMSKNRFVITKEILMNLILKTENNGYVRGSNNRLCNGCEKVIKAEKFRRFNKPDEIWDFCEDCPRSKIIMKAGQKKWQ